MAEQSWDLRLRLPCDSAAPAVVRHALTDRARLGWLLGDVMLVASELVANAVRHSGGAPDEAVCVEIRPTPAGVLVSVSDPGTSGSAAKPTPAPVPFGGMGLRVVDQLASRWGSERASGGRHRVWAELPSSDL